MLGRPHFWTPRLCSCWTPRLCSCEKWNITTRGLSWGTHIIRHTQTRHFAALQQRSWGTDLVVSWASSSTNASLREYRSAEGWMSLRPVLSSWNYNTGGCCCWTCTCGLVYKKLWTSCSWSRSFSVYFLSVDDNLIVGKEEKDMNKCKQYVGVI